MSQSHNPTDSQALLQSMLQRLKLQSGREGQAYLHTPESVTATSTWGQGGERGGSSNFQRINRSPGTNGIPSNEFGNINFSFKSGEIQKSGHVSAVDGGSFSFPFQKDNSDTGDKRVLGQATQPAITPIGTRQLFSDITSFERTDREKWSFGSSATTSNMPPNKHAAPSMGISENQDQGFKSKIYQWSMQPTDGELGALAQNKDVKIFSGDQKTANNSLRRKQQSSENKTRRWTQRIKERWRDRQGSFGKKGKEEGGTDEKSEQGTEVLTTESLVNTSNKDEKRTLPSLDTSGSSKMLPAHTEDSTKDSHIRSSSDFELGLGSFSLLEEIVKGQEWAKFLNPNLSASSANQRPSEEPLRQPRNQLNLHDGAQSNGILNQLGGGRNQWSFRSTGSSLPTGFSMAQISSDAFRPGSMKVLEGKSQQAEQSEPMEDSRNHSYMQSGGSRMGQHLSPPSFVGPADIQLNPTLKSRVTLSRKRQHQSAVRRDERLQADKMSDGEEADREGSMSSSSRTSNHMMAERRDSQQEDVIPLYTINTHPVPLSPSYFNPLAPAREGVLKLSIPQESESSMEIVNKRRRVEENRRVRFAEEVVTIDSPDMELDDTDSEEDYGADEDSVTEQECAMGQAATQEEAPARRSGFNSWLHTFKKKNAGRKRR